MEESLRRRKKEKEAPRDLAELNRLLDRLCEHVASVENPQIGPPGPDYFEQCIKDDRAAIIKLFGLETNMPSPFAKKAPDPKAYWKELAQKLQTADPGLFKELVGFHFKYWEASSVSYSKILADKAMKILGNQYDYAQSTYLTGLRNACVDIERAKPREVK